MQGSYTKITFRTPLYVGGSPNGYWLAKAAGTNRGFQGCLQSLSVNGKVVDMRPWPLGRALTGADVGEWKNQDQKHISTEAAVYTPIQRRANSETPANIA